MSAYSASQRAFAVGWKDLDRWVVPSHLLLRPILPKGWTNADVGTLVRQVVTRIKIDPDKEYKMAGVKWYGEGVFHRETVRGDEMSASHVTPLVPGALIYNRLFAWKASFAVVPWEFDDCYVSNEFPQFIPDTNRVLSDYLFLFCISDSAIRAVNAASTGSAAVSRNRFKEQFFLDFKIPLPPPDDQKSIVARWRKAQEPIEQAQSVLKAVSDKLNIILHTITDFRALETSRLALLWQDFDQWDVNSARAAAFRLANPGFVPLSQHAEEATEMVKPWLEPEKKWPVYGVNNKEGVFFSHFQKGAEFNAPYKRIRKNWFFHNPTRSSVGSLGIVPEVLDDAITSPEYQVWRMRSDSEWTPEFMAALIRTQWFVKLIQVHRVGAVKQRLYVENLLSMPMPDVPSAIRESAAIQRQTALQKLADARLAAELARTEIEALILGTRSLKDT
jgi:hypothetical protein